MNSDTIFVITGEHPDNCTGGAEMQAYLIAKGFSEYFEKTIFCTVFSKESSLTWEAKNLQHVSLEKEFLPRKIHKFIKYVKKYKPAVFYVRCLYSFWWIKLVGVLFNRPVVYHLSGDSQAEYQNMNLKKFPSVFIRNFYIWSTQFSSLVIAQTTEQAGLYKNTFDIMPKIVYNAQPPVKKEILKDYSKINVLWLGKSFKNPEKFAELAMMMKNDGEFNFIVGGMLSREQEKLLLEIQKSNSNFRYLGPLTRAEVFHELEKAHVLINTSSREGFPNTFIEAWKRGVIVISDKINPDNILMEKKIGFLCKTNEEIKDKLNRIFIDNIQVAKVYSENAAKYADECHNIDKTISIIYDYIKPFLKLNGKSSFS